MFEEAGGEWSDGHACNQALDQLSSSRVSKIEAIGVLKKSKIAWKYATLRQAITYRIVDLGEAAIREWSDNNTLSALIIARAFIETVAFLHYILIHAEKALLLNDIDALDKNIMIAHFGGRHEHWKLNGLEAINVLKALDVMTKKIPRTRDFYERISEICHPNSQGVSQFYSTLDRERVVVTFSRTKRDRNSVFSHIMGALLCAQWAIILFDDYDKCVECIAKLQVSSSNSDLG
ncbi:hypothetical protein [Blastochloris viridis]|uniref:Uncharacterized protein n=1 Tax=Blastochloris viridis TaxID=1079 RepID=A0A0S4Q407_BLAVI|nr:hypothetical protein [Blastochloris viridis]CUU43047.1 hypothetical protein BVIRIDIS_20640 [Blastochloris viridis]